MNFALCTLVPSRYNYSTGIGLRDPYTVTNVHYIVRTMSLSLSAPSRPRTYATSLFNLSGASCSLSTPMVDTT